jgi:hypothetical protein
MRFGAFQETRALRPPQRVLPKKLDWRRPLTQSPQANVSESSIRGLIDDGVEPVDVRSLGSAVS